MRQSAKLLTSFLAGALVALPGLALGQGLVPIDTSPIEDGPRTTPPTRPPDVDATTEDGDGDEPETEVHVQDLDDALPQDVDADDQGTEAGHGEVISALAECLPSGQQLHGTGMTKGHLMRQAATSGEVALGEGEQALPVSSVEEAEALCRVVQDLADQAEAPDHAVGRPEGAGPKDDGGPDGRSTRLGPPPHANARANR